MERDELLSFNVKIVESIFCRVNHSNLVLQLWKRKFVLALTLPDSPSSFELWRVFQLTKLLPRSGLHCSHRLPLSCSGVN